MSTGCDFHADALADLATGRLDPAREAPLRAHLGDCARCRDDLEFLTGVAAARPVPPAGLEARIRAAVREAAAEGGAPGAVPAGPGRAPAGDRRRASAWRPWALPLGAAAALAAVWLGVVDGGVGGPERPEEGPTGTEEVILASEGFAPYGAWPAGGVEVAGEPVLSELSADDLERLLEAMEP